MSAHRERQPTKKDSPKQGEDESPKSFTESVAAHVTSLILQPPPCIIGPGKAFMRKVLLRPSALKVYSVDLGCSVSRSLASSMVGSSLLSSALGAELSAAATFTSAAQVQSLGLLALRIPLKAAGGLVGNGPAMTRLIELISDYAVRNAGAVAAMSEMGMASQVATVGVKGSILGAIATAAVQESIAVAYYCHGGGTFDVLAHQTTTIGMSAASTVGGGTVGAAMGCLVLPGIGTAVGSLVGGYVGSLVPFYSRGNGYAHQRNEDPRNPSRKLKAVDVQSRTSRAFRGETADMGGGWLEVVDCSTESYFRFGEEGIGSTAHDSLAMLREYDSSSGQLSHGGNSMCGFGAASSSVAGLRSDMAVAEQSSAASWGQMLTPSYWRGGGAAQPQPQPTAHPASRQCSSFFVSRPQDVPRPSDDEMIIYFRPMEGREEEDAVGEFSRTFASCLSAGQAN